MGRLSRLADRIKGTEACLGGDEPEERYNLAQRAWFRVWLAWKRAGWLARRISRRG